jgi:hypothetical protein
MYKNTLQNITVSNEMNLIKGPVPQFFMVLYYALYYVMLLKK